MKTVKVLSFPFHCQNPDGYAIFIMSNISNCSMKDGVCRKHVIAFSKPLSICEVSCPSEAYRALTAKKEGMPRQQTPDCLNL